MDRRHPKAEMPAGIPMALILSSESQMKITKWGIIAVADT